MNHDFIKTSKVSIVATDDSFSVGRNMESMKQKAYVCLGKLENLNFDLDIKKNHAEASKVNCQ